MEASKRSHNDQIISLSWSCQVRYFCATPGGLGTLSTIWPNQAPRFGAALCSLCQHYSMESSMLRSGKQSTLSAFPPAAMLIWPIMGLLESVNSDIMTSLQTISRCLISCSRTCCNFRHHGYLVSGGISPSPHKNAPHWAQPLLLPDGGKTFVTPVKAIKQPALVAKGNLKAHELVQCCKH